MVFMTLILGLCVVVPPLGGSLCTPNPLQTPPLPPLMLLPSEDTWNILLLLLDMEQNRIFQVFHPNFQAEDGGGHPIPTFWEVSDAGN